MIRHVIEDCRWAPTVVPTDGAMIDAAHDAVWFDGFWAINRRADFKKGVGAMIRAAMKS